MKNLLDRRLIINMGKGGVGKSVISASLAKLAVDSGKRVLLVQINTQDKISDYLGVKKSTGEISEVMPNLFSVNISPDKALKEYALMQVKIEFIYKLVFENRAVRYFLRAVPALNDLVVLGKIYYHVNQTFKRSDRPLYDLIIVDAPPTGHGMFLINLPNVMLKVVKNGPIFREATGMQSMLRDPSKTLINLISLAEEMPVAETMEMYEAIRDDYNYPMGLLFVNAVFPDMFDTEDENCILNLVGQGDDDLHLSSLGKIAATVSSRRRLCEKYLKMLEENISLPMTKVPYIFSRNFGPKEVQRVIDAIRQKVVEV